MNEAIKLAIEKGGYEPKMEVKPIFYFLPIGESGAVDPNEIYATEDAIHTNSFLLDPLFWQALGRACGWEKKVCDCLGSGITCYSCEKWGTQVVGMDWKEYWHRFIDWIAEGKNTDDFFTNLIGKE